MTDTLEQARQDLAAAAQDQHALDVEAERIFDETWQAAVRSAGMNDDTAGLVRWASSPSIMAVEIADFTEIIYSGLGEIGYQAYDLGDNLTITRVQAAEQADIPEATLEQMEPLVRGAFKAALPSYTEARRAGARFHELAAATHHNIGSPEPSGAREWPPQDEVEKEDRWAVTPERALGTWIETTTRLRTLIDTEQYTAVRSAIRETNSYLDDYTSGGTPPGSFEEEYLYLDALNRATVPLPSPAPAQVLTEMRARGERVPDFPDPGEVADATGVRGLHVSELQRALTRPGKSPTPRTHESVAFAGAWRAATKHLGEDLVVSYDLPDAPGQALVERLDGNLDSYVSVMRTGPNEIILNDATGNDIEESELGQRLGLDQQRAGTVMTGLRDGLEAAENLRQAPPAGPAADPLPDHAARTERQAPVDPLTSAHLPPHSPTSTNSPSRS